MLHEAEFWVAVAFVIFLAVIWKVGGFATLISGIDARAERIRAELGEAQRLRQEAEALLREYQAKRAAAESEAADILALARDEAERLARETEEKLSEFVQRRTAAAEAKIAQAESQAAAEVRAAAVAAAVRASEQVLRSQLAGKAGEDMVTTSLPAVRAKLQ